MQQRAASRSKRRHKAKVENCRIPPSFRTILADVHADDVLANDSVSNKGAAQQDTVPSEDRPTLPDASSSVSAALPRDVIKQSRQHTHVVYDSGDRAIVQWRPRIRVRVRSPGIRPVNACGGRCVSISSD
jgi:hypothetical protein